MGHCWVRGPWSISLLQISQSRPQAEKVMLRVTRRPIEHGNAVIRQGAQDQHGDGAEAGGFRGEESKSRRR